MNGTDGRVRHDWSVEQIEALHDLPLLELVGRANAVHRDRHDPNRVQRASLLSIKTGGCPEDCAYCRSRRIIEVDFDTRPADEPARGRLALRATREGRRAKIAVLHGRCLAEVRDGNDFDRGHRNGHGCARSAWKLRHAPM